MKKSIFTLAILLCALVGKAQVTDEQSAILQNGDNAQIFYGADALKEALAAAPDRGATITLSAGTFNGAEVTKCVNIYGAGWIENKTPRDNDNPADNSILPTIISSSLSINISEELTAPHNIHIEGVTLNTRMYVAKSIDGLEIMKCYLNDALSISAENKNIVLTQCFDNGGVGGLGDAIIQNCYISNLNSISVRSAESKIVVDHCVIAGGYYAYNGTCKYLCTNSMIFTGGNPVPPSSTFRFCMIDAASISNMGSTDNWFGINWGDIFDDAVNIYYNDNRTWKMKDEAKAIYIGSDGTEVGINGGKNPWNKTPHTPLVKDLKLNIDGTQLKVNYTTEVR